MRILFIFLDGIGLGDDNPTLNPFAVAHTPTLNALANHQRWLRNVGIQATARGVFLALDAQLGIAGRPQSGTSQAAILTGLNVPQMLNRHYGPKPDADTRRILERDNLFMRLKRAGKSSALINAYPPRLLHDIARGKTLRSSIQHAVYAAGLPLFDKDALYAGTALSEDFTGEGWRTHLKFSDAPIYSPFAVGVKMVEIARGYDFAFFSHWLTDILGHRGTLAEGVPHLEIIDGVMAGVLSAWRDDEGLVVLTSDHGNFEDLSHGKHTENRVPAVIIGQESAAFAQGLHDLTGLAPRIADWLTRGNAPQEVWPHMPHEERHEE